MCFHFFWKENNFCDFSDTETFPKRRSTLKGEICSWKSKFLQEKGCINPIALRTAKFLWSFGCFECIWVIWLVSCFGLNGPLRDSISVYIGRLSERGRKKREIQTGGKMSKPPPPAPTASAVGPCPTLIQISRTPQHWKFTQQHRTTRPPTQ